MARRVDVIYLFDVQSNLRQITDEIIELVHTEQKYSLFARLSTGVSIDAGWRIGFKCIDGRFRMFEVDTHELSEPDGTISINATDLAVRELSDVIVTDKRPTNMTAPAAVTSLIAGTRWALGAATAIGTGSVRVYYQTLWSALSDVMTTYDCAVVPYYEYVDGAISARKIDVLDKIGTQRGRLFEVGDDAKNVVVSIDDSQIKTALYGRGKGVEIEGDADTGTSYGRRLTFADIVWAKAAGDPADKPAGQEWIGDPSALVAFGRDGMHRFGVQIFEDVTDPNELLRQTWDYLQEIKHPRVTISARVQDTEMLWGYGHQAVRLGDDVTVRIASRGIDIAARVVGVARDYIRPENTELTIGNAQITSGALFANVKRRVDKYADHADVWDRANAFDLQGAMDVMNNQIVSTTGHWYTDKETGAIMLVTEDGTKAMRLSGAGWQIASAKIGGVWQWRTAATGTGIVADEITTGTLQASAVKILGSNRFFWDAENLYIIDPSSNNRQIRIGRFDGTRYGIGFTSDGGATWTQTIDYTGISISSDIPDGSISSQKLADNAVTGTKISAGSITTPKIATAGLNASVIKAGTIDANSVSITGTGTSLNGTTLRIKHPSINAGAETTIGLEGLKMILNGKVIGGMYKDTDGSVISATSALLNTTSWPLFRVLVGSASGIGYAMPSIELKYGSATGGYIGVPTTYDGTSMGLGLQSMQDMYLDSLGDINLSAFDSVVDNGGGIFMSAGKKGMAFSYTRADGTTGKVTLKQLDDFFNS